MNSSLSQLSLTGRRRAALAAAVLAALSGLAGVLPWTSRSPGVLRALSVVVLLIAGASALVGWGLARSVRLDYAEAHFDEAVRAGVSSADAAQCGCAHEHDPDELHITDAPP
ncbi:MAG: hypothetical protein ABJB98_01455 [Actinomycetota bacterium]